MRCWQSACPLREPAPPGEQDGADYEVLSCPAGCGQEFQHELCLSTHVETSVCGPRSQTGKCDICLKQLTPGKPHSCGVDCPHCSTVHSEPTDWCYVQPVGRRRTVDQTPAAVEASKAQSAKKTTIYWDCECFQASENDVQEPILIVLRRASEDGGADWIKEYRGKDSMVRFARDAWQDTVNFPPPITFVITTECG